MMEVSPRGMLLILVISCQALFCFGVEVSTSKGKMTGSDKLKSRDGRTIYSFTGIPYAKPPIGELRFKEAQPAEPWSETFDATKKITSCPETKGSTFEDTGTERRNHEDCLILNVYSPKVDKSAHLPVLAMIHGGAFAVGSSEPFGPEYLLEKDVVLVTMNFRLGALGFASTGDDTIPANLGLKDQVLALKWVHDNIEGFGGDPSKVTVLGDSSGAVCAHMHLLSPMTKGLIQGGMASSGSAYVPWGLIDPKLAKERTKSLAVLVGCPMEPAKDMLSCMQKVPAGLILEMSDKFSDFIFSPFVTFGPTIETGNVKNAFLPAHPRKLESQLPLITGVNSGEGGVVASMISGGDGRNLKELTEDPDHYLPKILQLKQKFPEDKIPEINQKIKEFYFGDKPVDKSTTQELVDVSTDSWFLDGAIEAATNYKGKVYFYYYDYEHSVSHNSIYGNGEVKGVSHSDMLLNFFPLTSVFSNRKLSESDIQVSKRMIDLLTNFAKTGKPSDTMPEWKATEETAKDAKFLHITAKEPNVEENLLPKRVDFWRDLDRLELKTTDKRSTNVKGGKGRRM